MKTQLKLRSDAAMADCLTIHPDTANELRLLNSDIRSIRFGIKSHEVQITTSSELQLDEAWLSHGIVTKLQIPLSPRYEIIVKNNEIRIGPYIGFLVSLKPVVLNITLEECSGYLHCYDEIGGAVVAFSFDGINTSDLTIQGYMYNPEAKQWEKGTYAYPASFFRELLLNPWKKHFQSHLGDTIFNNFSYDKWKMYELLQSSPILKNHLPLTKPLTKIDDIRSFLNIHPHVYIKPIYGSKGRSIKTVMKQGDGVVVRFNEQGENQNLYFENIEDSYEFIETDVKKENYIIQAACDVISLGDKVIDFRLLLIKSGDGNWHDMGIIVRYGKSGNIVSNISAGGTFELGEPALKSILHLTDEQVDEIKKEMSLLAFEAAKYIDATGVNCGEIAVDIGIDKKGDIWIFEIQHNAPYIRRLFTKEETTEMYYRILRHKMLYLKRLAGFAQEQ